MKKYPHLVSQLFNRPLLITRAKHAAICRVLDARLAAPRAETVEVEPEEPEDEPYVQVNDTAIIAVHGILGKHLDQFEMMSGGCACDTVAGMIDIALQNTGVGRIIFDFRSPGGSVTGIPELGRKIANITSKQTIAFTDSECCSGALWLAEQCQTFYATESACLGSIGVWCAYWDLTRKLEMDGERMQCISAGKYKTMGAYWQPLTPDELKILQADVDKIHSQFQDAVNLRRQVADEFMQGQTFDGPDALAAGLIDGLVEDLDEIL